MDIESLTITGPQAAKALGIPLPTLDSRSVRGIVPDAPRDLSRRGGPRVYGFADLVALRVADDLMAFFPGVKSPAIEAVDVIRKRLTSHSFLIGT